MPALFVDVFEQIGLVGAIVWAAARRRQRQQWSRMLYVMICLPEEIQINALFRAATQRLLEERQVHELLPCG
jgi:hypothetical protein